MTNVKFCGRCYPSRTVLRRFCTVFRSRVFGLTCPTDSTLFLESIACILRCARCENMWRKGESDAHTVRHITLWWYWRDHIISFHHRRSRSAERLDAFFSTTPRWKWCAAKRKTCHSREQGKQRERRNERGTQTLYASLANNGNQSLLQTVESAHMSFNRLERP